MQVPLMIMVDIEDVNDLDSIECGITQACRRLPSRAMQKVAQMVEEIAESQDPGRLRRKSKEKRTLWMTCGCAEFERRRYADVLEEKSYVLFDLRTGLVPRQRMTEAAALMFSELAAIAPSYDKTREEVERLWGDSPSTATIWNHTQRVGEQMRQRAKSEREAVFRDGELPGADIPPKDFVAVETDSSMVDAWQKPAEHHEIFVGIAYDGKEYTGKKARPRLTNKVAAVSLDGSTTFGADMYIAAQKYHNISEARLIHYASDGDPRLETLRQMHFYRADHHLDHRHVTSKAYEAYTYEHRESADTLLGFIFGEKRSEFEAAIARDMRRLKKRKSKLEEYRSYILDRWDWIFAARRMKRNNPHIDIPKHISGTGGDERMVGVLVGHRMKHRGMGWTKDGAANIMHVRMRALGLQDH
jgi:hypothetical protein